MTAPAKAGLRPGSRDLQLAGDSASRFLPAVIAVMVCLATLALAGALALERTADAWYRGAEGRLTVQINDTPGQSLDLRLQAAQSVLNRTPGVVRADILDRTAVEALLAPWLGPDMPADLPMPGLIDVELARGEALDIDALRARVGATVPGTRIDDPRTWLDRLGRLAALLRTLGFGIVAATGLAMIAIVVFATKAGLSSQREVIEVLHLIGARDGYIARQFERHTLKLALLGAVPGLLVAAVVALVLGRVAASLDSALLPDIAFGLAAWAALGVLPLGAALLAMLTARLTVIGALKQMM